MDLQHALDRFSAAYDQGRMKIRTEKTKVLCLSRNPRRCAVQVSGSTVQQVETFEYHEWWKAEQGDCYMGW